MGAYYRTEQRNGRWTLLDPAGRPFYSLGVNCFNYHLGEPMDESLMRKYGGGPSWYDRWAEARLQEVWGLGFNTLGAWHPAYFWRKPLPKTIEIRCSRSAKMVNNGWGGYGFPDVFDPSFAASTHQAMAETFCEKGFGLAEDESIVGFYTDNELHWWGSGGHWGQSDPGEGTNDTGLVEDYIRLPADAAGKKAWVNHLRERYGGSIDRLNEAWDAEYDAFDELLWLKECRAREAAFEQDKLAFLRTIADTYFRITSGVLRQYDANHLNLGCRFVGTGTPLVVLEAMKDVVDVVSLNFYTFTLPERWLAEMHELTGKPAMITEFSFCAGSSAGFDLITNGAQLAHVRDQKRRGECYRAFAMQAAGLPYMVGTHWFALYDFQDRKGLIGNYGLYDREDKLWTEFAEAVRETHGAIASVLAKEV